MRVHLIGLPHYDAIRSNEQCAYSQKNRRLGAMLHAHGHELLIYGGPDNEAECSEHVVIVTDADRERWFGGPWDPNIVFGQFDSDLTWWQEMNHAAANAIIARWEPGDALGITMGRAQEQIVREVAAVHPNPLTLETGVGYDGILPDSHCAFESLAWRHHVYGLRGITQGRAFDTVIPNAFFANEYRQAPSDGYLLFLGRHIEQKGLAVVRELAQRYEVVTAGQGGPIDGIEWRGVVTGAEKADLLAGARALLCPTTYIEPFGGVAVEAMMSGVPVLASDWGAFTETVGPEDGFRCSTLQEWVDGAEAVDKLDREQIAVGARARFSTEAIAPLYDRWLARCDQLHRNGWYDLRD